MRGSRSIACLLLAVAVTACASSRSGPASGGGTMETGVATMAASGGQMFDIRIVEEISVSSDPIVGAVGEAWRVLPDVHREIGIPIGTRNPRAHLVGNEGFEVHRELGDTRLSNYLQCGRSNSGANADHYRVRMTVLSQLVEDVEAGTVLSTHVRATATRRGVSGHAVRCSTTGRLEREIMEAVQLRLTQDS